jgi:hypothetical protein
MRRALLAACLTAATVATAALASRSEVALDRSHGVRFELAGSVLTVRLVPQSNRSPPDVRKEVWGTRIDAICSPTFRPRKSRRPAVRAVRLWPRGQEELTYTFRRDISDRVKWCLLEDGGVDVAGVDFEVFIPVRGGTPKDRRIGRELRRYLRRTAGAEGWLNRVKAIVVDRGVIAVVTNLRRNQRGRRMTRRLCGLIHRADVADLTPGRTIFGRHDIVLRECRPRE